MAQDRQRLSDTEIVAICDAELDASSATSGGGELSGQMADALDYYLGEPYGDEIEGRSQIRTREVLDTIEWIKPSLMRIFSDSENILEFDAVGPEDEQQAEQETDRVSHAYWKENRGFYNTLTFITDALLSKVGVVKTTWDDRDKVEREEYDGLDDNELGMLVFDETVEREVIEYEQTDTGHRVVFETRPLHGKPVVEAIAPENFGVERSARSPYAKDCNFCWHRELMTRGDLLEAGYDRKVVERLPPANAVETELELSRRHLDDEQMELRASVHTSMQEIWVTECYVRVDRDGDGINELLKVTLATGSVEAGANSTLLDIEEVDRIPFATVTPVLLTHKFYGLSIADLVMDLQRIKSTLTRGVLDNMYLANNGQTAINDRVNVDDVLTSRPGGVRRVEGKEPIDGAIIQMQHPAPPPETFGLLEYLDGERKSRVGVGDETAALDVHALSNMNTGVAALAFDAARAKIELMAEIFAEIGFRVVFQDLHELLSKNLRKAHVVKLRGQWATVNPSEWKTRENVTLNVGLGVASKERRILGLERVLEGQILAMQSGFPITTPQHVYRCVADLTKELGHDPQKYWIDPTTVPPKPPQPDPQMMALEMSGKIEQGKLMLEREKNQLQAARYRAEFEARQIELSQKRDEAIMRAQMEALKAEAAMMKSQLDFADRDQRAQLESLIAEREQHRADLQVALEQSRSEAESRVDVFRAVLQSGTQLTTAQMSAAGADQGGAVPYIEQVARDLGNLVSSQLQEYTGMQAQQLGQVSAALVELREESQAPKRIERDVDGLIVSVNGRPVERDANGMLIGV